MKIQKFSKFISESIIFKTGDKYRDDLQTLIDDYGSDDNIEISEFLPGNFNIIIGNRRQRDYSIGEYIVISEKATDILRIIDEIRINCEAENKYFRFSVGNDVWSYVQYYVRFEKNT